MRLLLLLTMVLSGCVKEEADCANGGCLELTCDPADRCCSSFDLTDEECGEDQLTADGWDDFPGSGRAFIVNAVAIGGQSRGDNLDGLCDETGCIDNSMWRVGELMNDQLRQALLGGETLMLVEISGLMSDYRGWDRSVTVKIYSVKDADEPFFPANNFKAPPGHDKCCEFIIHPESLAGTQPLARIPARIRDGRIETVERASIAIPWFSVTDDERSACGVLEFDRTAIFAELPRGLTELNVGLLTGALLVRSMATMENPYCKTVSPRCPVQFTDSYLTDLYTSLSVFPDIDLDGDGLECLLDTNGDGAIDRCCSTCSGTACNGTDVAPVDPELPPTCAENVRDGYSIAITWSGVKASIVGTGP